MNGAGTRAARGVGSRMREKSVKHRRPPEDTFPEPKSPAFTAGVGSLFIIAGAVLIVAGFYVPTMEFTGETEWLNEPGAWMLIAVLGMAFVAAGTLGIFDAISRKDAKFQWRDLPKVATGRLEPSMRYEKVCPICKGRGFLEAKTLHDGKFRMFVYHAVCEKCGYDFEFLWISRFAAAIIISIMLISSAFIAQLLYVRGGLFAVLFVVPYALTIVLMVIGLYFMWNYAIIRNRFLHKFINRLIVKKIESWNSSHD